MDKSSKACHPKPHAGRELGMALLVTLIIMAIVGGLSFILLNATFQNVKVHKFLEQDFKALQIAESGLDKSIYCLNETEGTHCGGTFGSSYTGETDVAMGDSSFTTTVVLDNPDGRITSVGKTSEGKTATVSSDITTDPRTSPIPLHLAVSTGASGLFMENNAEIFGTVTSNGDVHCESILAEISGDVSVSNIGGSIDGCTILDHDAYADNVLNSVVAGDAYYDEDPSGISGSTIYGYLYWSQPTPTPMVLPTVDLDFWREGAKAGGVITGDFVPAHNSTLGPIKIDGDLIFSIGVSVTIGGPIWVTGNVLTDNNAEITLDPAYERFSAVILGDDPNGVNGKMTFDPGINISGNSDPRSFIAFISTNDSLDPVNPAIDIKNNADGALFYAPYGVLNLNNNAGAKAVAGEYLVMKQNAVITFEEDIWESIFSVDPADSRWRLREGKWVKKR